MSHYASGRRLEWKVRDYLIERGWTFLMRAAGSKGPFDLVMIAPSGFIVFIQVKTKSSAKDRREIRSWFGRCRALLVTWPKRGKPTFCGNYPMEVYR